MIQLNLLPDVKLQYIQARRTQHLVTTLAVIVTGVSLFILILLFMVVDVFQKGHLKDVNNDIGNYSQQIKDNKDLPKILTVQNQLKSLPTLLAQRPVVSRLFAYLAKIVPAKVSVSQTNIDFGQYTMTLTGSADNITNINRFVDTLKFTTYTTPTVTTPTKVFSNVVLASFGRTDKGATYTINLNYDKAIFDSAQVPTLTVPKITTTRSSADEPIFKDLPSASTQTGQPQ